MLDLRLRELGEAAVHRHAEHRQVLAELQLAGAARVARITALHGVDGDAVALGQPVTLCELSRVDDFTADLVTEDERPLPVRRPDRALAVVVLDVRAAEPARENSHDHLVGLRIRLRYVLQPEVFGLVEDCCFHGVLTFPARGDRVGR